MARVLSVYEDYHRDEAAEVPAGVAVHNIGSTGVYSSAAKLYSLFSLRLGRSLAMDSYGASAYELNSNGPLGTLRLTSTATLMDILSPLWGSRAQPSGLG